MKILLIILALMIAMPSLQASGCDMGGSADSTEQAMAGHDCCPGESETEAPAQDPQCDENGHCAGCFISAAAVSLQLQSIEKQRPESVFQPQRPSLVSSHSAPPYRPPIS